MTASVLRYRRLWWVLWLAGWVLCVALSLGPVLVFPLPIGQGDKFGHALAYAVLMAWACWILPRGGMRVAAILCLWLLGVLMEFGQALLTTHRVMDGWDVLANSMGLALGAAVGAGLGNPLLAIERRWFRQAD